MRTTIAIRPAGAALLAVVLFAGVAAAQYCTPDQCDECDLCNRSVNCCHELPELWVVNTRCAPKCGDFDQGFERICVMRYDADCCRFVAETWESMLAQEASMPTLIFAHGNTLDHDGAMKQCWDVYARLRCCPGQKRLVFWSWPAEPVTFRPILCPREMIQTNLMTKYVYAEYQGYYMAKLVQRMSMTQRVTVGGHSYGGIIAAVSAHFIGAGELRGVTLPGAEPTQRANFRAAIVSGAFDNDMMCPGGRYGQAFIAAEKVFVTRNCLDSTLQRWPDISWRGRNAIGVTGIDADCLGEHANKLCQQTLTDDVEESHYIEPHLESARFMSALCCISFGGAADGIAGAEPNVATQQPAANSGFLTPSEAVDSLRELVPLPGRAWQRRGILP